MNVLSHGIIKAYKESIKTQEEMCWRRLMATGPPVAAVSRRMGADRPAGFQVVTPGIWQRARPRARVRPGFSEQSITSNSPLLVTVYIPAITHCQLASILNAIKIVGSQLM